MPYNTGKAKEFGRDNAAAPARGVGTASDSRTASASTLSEDNVSAKTDALDRSRSGATGQARTTNHGVAIGDNQTSLKSGLRGPTLLEDFVLREKITPVFARFSTVAGERGSTDTARDIRGFAVKFYTDEGNWDLVGNNIPVFFIQDAMKFPDLIHAVKPEPHNGMPQVASAHDTFWDFASLMPESTHTLMWEEAVKISGADSDFHRRDLWEAIESGEYPEWELGLQIFTEAQAESFSFDVLDATKLIPEELVPLTPAGRMVLNRNPDNFFAETEQVAFCTAHVVPGIDFSSDPLLAGRIHSCIDTQITRLGVANFHEIPINAPLAAVYNNQRDGIHRQAIPRGRVAYEPNSLGGGCPFQAGAAGFVSFPQPVEGDKLRGKPEKFADHCTQATLFYDSQTAVEKAHIAGGFRFELSKVAVPAIRERMVSSLVNVSGELAATVAAGLGIHVPPAMPMALAHPAKAEVAKSSALSLMALPGDGGIRSRSVAIPASSSEPPPRPNAPPLDPKSDDAASQTAATRRFKSDAVAQSALADTVKLSKLNASNFDAVFYPGGHGPLWDLAEDAASIALVDAITAAGKPVAAVCHAPGVLQHARNPTGESLLRGKNVTGFTNTEEEAAGLTKVVPFLVEDMLEEQGGKFSKAADGQPHVVVDGLLITGQNPASSEAAAKALLAALGRT
jgi:catalase